MNILPESGKAMHHRGDTAGNNLACWCVRYTMLAYALVWILNELNVFIIDKGLIRKSFVTAELVLMVCLMICRFVDTSRGWVKYMILTFFVVSATVVGIAITYHAVLFSIFPIVYSMIYSSRRLTAYTVVATIISSAVVIFAGYYIGICDANMVLLTNRPMCAYISEEGTFMAGEINQSPIRNLALYFLFPRCIIYLALIPVCTSVSRLMRLHHERAVHMELLAKTDSLTKLHSRDAGQKKISRMIGAGKTGTFCISDLDDFKNINDQFGHDVGDQVLATVGECMGDVFRNEDVVFRLGGDEFIFFLEGMSDKEVCDACIGRLRGAISRRMEQRLPQCDVSLSVGGVIFQNSGEITYQELYQMSDCLLYEAKRGGKSRNVLKYLDEMECN